MLYKNNSTEAVLNILQNKMLKAASCIQGLVEEGYIPNKRKWTILNFSIIIGEIYNNIDYLSEEQRNNLNILYNKFISI